MKSQSGKEKCISISRNQFSPYNFYVIGLELRFSAFFSSDLETINADLNKIYCGSPVRLGLFGVDLNLYFDKMTRFDFSFKLNAVPRLEKHGCHGMILPWSYHDHGETWSWSFHDNLFFSKVVMIHDMIMVLSSCFACFFWKIWIVFQNFLK